MDERLSFPMRNIPVLRWMLNSHSLVSTISSHESILPFRDLILRRAPDSCTVLQGSGKGKLSRSELFAKSVESALMNSIKNKIPVILIFEKMLHAAWAMLCVVKQP